MIRAAPAAATTVATRLRDLAERTPDAVVLRHKRRGVWREITWAQYWDRVLDCAHGLLALGVECGDRVAIHSENRPAWLYMDLAAVAIRAMSVGLYPTSPTAEVSYLLQHSGARILLAEDQEQVDKALAASSGLPRLERIVYLEPRGIRQRYTDERLLQWGDLLDLGRAHRDAAPGVVAALMAQAAPSDVVALVYTSGTSGPPKGAMLTAANVEFCIQALARGGFMSPPPSSQDVTLSYLPLCHVAERVFTTWFNLSSGHVVHFAESVQTVAGNLCEVQPTIFFGVPRIWEKLHAGVEIRLAAATRFKRANARLWLALAAWIGDALAAAGGRHRPATRAAYALGWLFLYRSLQDRLGLRRCRYAGCGAAPIAPEILKWFMGIGVPLHESYGMTENTAIATVNRPGRIALGTVGEPLAGTEVAVADDGEILTRHPGVFAGYWRDEEATRAAVDPDGWLHTGDVGAWVSGVGGGLRRGEQAGQPGRTHLRITGRSKDLIITAGGKNIAPNPIESALKASPYIKDAVVIGDRRPYLVALIGIDPETLGDWAARRRLPYTTHRDLSSKPEVVALVQGVVDRVNEQRSRAEGVKRFRLLPKALDHEDGELTATQKVKRAAIAERFADLVASLYGEG